jgi:hypothetical protein
MKLAAELRKRSTGWTIYMLDEPTTSLGGRVALGCRMAFGGLVGGAGFGRLLQLGVWPVALKPMSSWWALAWLG